MMRFFLSFILVFVFFLNNNSLLAAETDHAENTPTANRRPVAAPPDLTLQTLVEQTAPELKLLFPKKHEVWELVKEVSTLLENLEEPNPNDKTQFLRSLLKLTKLGPETLQKLQQGLPSSKFKTKILLSELIKTKQLSLEALRKKYEKSGKATQAEKVAMLAELFHRIGNDKNISFAIVISPESITRIKNEIASKLKSPEGRAFLKKHQNAFLSDNPEEKAKGMAIASKDLMNGLLKWDKSNGELLAKLLDPNGTDEALQVLREFHKENNLPFMNGKLFLPEDATKQLINALTGSISEVLLPEIQHRAYQQGAASVKAILPGPRARRQSRRGNGASMGASDAVQGLPYNNRGDKIGGRTAYDMAYHTARQKIASDRLKAERDSKLLIENTFNEAFKGMGKLEVVPTQSNENTDGVKYSYAAFYTKKENGSTDTYFSHKLALLDEITKKPENGANSFLRSVLDGQPMQDWMDSQRR